MSNLLTLMVCLTLYVWVNALWADTSGVVAPMSAECASCHGADGNNQDLQGPNLAGQNKLYLIKQIISFSKGSRIHPILSSDSLELGSEELDKLAAYYANLKPENPANKLSGDGAELYSSCLDCHGVNGEGITAFPRLIGQKPDYIKQQLIYYKTGVRQSSVMQAISVNLSDEEITLLAGYLGSQQTRVASPSQNSFREHSSAKANKGTIAFASTDRNAIAANKTASKVFVIVGSTTSRGEAIEHAIVLKSLGYSSEVILSSTGYYGVALGRFNVVEAHDVIMKAKANKVATENAYIMTMLRVKEHIYRSADKSGASSQTLNTN